MRKRGPYEAFRRSPAVPRALCRLSRERRVPWRRRPRLLHVRVQPRPRPPCRRRTPGARPTRSEAELWAEQARQRVRSAQSRRRRWAGARVLHESARPPPRPRAQGRRRLHATMTGQDSRVPRSEPIGRRPCGVRTPVPSRSAPDHATPPCHRPVLRSVPLATTEPTTVHHHNLPPTSPPRAQTPRPPPIPTCPAHATPQTIAACITRTPPPTSPRWGRFPTGRFRRLPPIPNAQSPMPLPPSSATSSTAPSASSPPPNSTTSPRSNSSHAPTPYPRVISSKPSPPSPTSAPA